MKPHVLIVDDSMQVRMDLRGALTTAGFSVTSCETKAATVQALKVKPFDLAILDTHLPDGSGMDLLAEIKQTPELRTIRVFMLSTQAELPARLQGFGLGADLYAGKPYDRNYLVREALELFKGASDSAPQGARRPQRGQKLLLVDDNPTFLNALAAVLRQEGNEVVLATSGEDALALVAVERFDGILLDRVMPGLDGIKTCRQLRALRGMESIPIALMTGSIDPAAEAEALQAGVDAVLNKPVQLGQLSERWRALCKRKHQAQSQPSGTASSRQPVAAAQRPARGPLLYQQLLRASGLSELMARTVVDRALERIGATPDQIEAEQIQRALPQIRGLLRTFMPLEEVSRRIEEIAALTGTAERPAPVAASPAT